MKINRHALKWIALTLVVVLSGSSPALGLLAGIFTVTLFSNHQKKFTSTLGKWLLQISVVLLGFKLQIATVLSVGKNSVFITAGTIFLVLVTGYFIGRVFRLEKKLSTLISGGTAICGGSAIAAIAPVISASSSQIAVSMGIVFLLNGVALFIFPPIGHFFNLSQEQFGLWAAIAIHDTSSVVGATVSYGAEAAAIGTTIKLVRALWILPVAFIFAKLHKSESKARFPLFLIAFLMASVLRSVFPEFELTWNFLAHAGGQLMAGTLFLIGLNLSFKDLQAAGGRTLAAAVVLWLVIALSSLGIIVHYGGISFV